MFVLKNLDEIFLLVLSQVSPLHNIALHFHLSRITSSSSAAIIIMHQLWQYPLTTSNGKFYFVEIRLWCHRALTSIPCAAETVGRPSVMNRDFSASLATVRCDQYEWWVVKMRICQSIGRVYDDLRIVFGENLCCPAVVRSKTRSGAEPESIIASRTLQTLQTRVKISCITNPEKYPHHE